jgi:hypothetical protein
MFRKPVTLNQCTVHQSVNPISQQCPQPNSNTVVDPKKQLTDTQLTKSNTQQTMYTRPPAHQSVQQNAEENNKPNAKQTGTPNAKSLVLVHQIPNQQVVNQIFN